MEQKTAMLPYLKIAGPEAEQYHVPLDSNQLIMGRLSKTNDVVLEPDPQNLVSRQMHCSIEKREKNHWVVDNASTNGTFLRRDNSIKRVQGEERLQNHDEVLILAKINRDGEARYWTIQFIDPQATQPARFPDHQRFLEYDWLQAKVYNVSDSERKEIPGITPLEHKLLRYMDRQNKNNSNVSVMCTYDELIRALWGEDNETQVKNDVSRLIWGLRKKIEPDPGDPVFIKTVRGLGYCLVAKPVNGIGKG